MIEALVLGLSLIGMLYFFKQNNSFVLKKVNWNAIESICVTLFIYVFSQVGLVIIVTLVAQFSGNFDKLMDWFSENNLGVFISVLIVEIITFGLLINFLKRRKASLAEIGLGRKPIPRDLLIAVGVAVIYFAVFIVVASLISKMIPAINIDQEQELGFKNVKNIELPLVFLSLVVLPPLLEEIIARGFLYSGLKNNLSIYKATLITSFLFAIAHLQPGTGKPLLWIATIDTFILSIFLVYLREKTGSLWAPIFLHGIKNLIAFMSLYIWHIA